MVKEQPKFLAVLPWLQLAEEIEVGPFTFWRWPKDRERYIVSEEIEYVTASLNANFRHLDMEEEKWVLQNLEFESLCLISHKEKGTLFVRGGFENILEDMQKAVDILCACSLFQTLIKRDSVDSETPSAREIFYKNSTDFTWYVIPLGVETGSKQIRRRYGSIRSVEFPPIPRVKPDECTNQKVIEKDGLVTSLGKMLESSPTDFSRRIFRAIEQFNNAFTDSMVISHLTEIVMLGTAFEILLGLSKKFGKKKRRKLTNIFIKWFDWEQTSIKQPENVPWKVYWIHRFYDLRNKIVHGDRITLRDLEWRSNPYAGLYNEIAIYVFRLLLMKLLVKNNLHTETEEDIWQANKLDEWLSTEMESFPNGKDFDVAFWRLRKKNKAEGRA